MSSERALVLAALETHGLLLLADNRRPALAQFVAGGPIAGSWWAHADGHAIFAMAGRLEEHPDVLAAKVVDRKVTFVHRRLWPAWLGVAAARAPWQLAGLTPGGAALLERLDREDVHGEPALAELGERWLADVRQVHTDAGRHERVGRSWGRWAGETGVVGLPYEEAVSEVRAAVAGIGGGRLPF